jgi:serpin B
MLKQLLLALLICLLSLRALPLVADEPNELTDEVKNLAKTNSAFALDLYGQLSCSDGDLFFSPISLSSVLSLLHQGAKGEAKSQLEKTLRFPVNGQQPVAKTMAELTNYLENRANYQNKDLKRDTKIELSLVNSLWPKLGLKIRPEYLNSLGDQPPIFEANFAQDGPGTQKKINDWISDNTKGKIVDFLATPPPASSTLILINAVYFQGLWSFPFNPEKTAPQDFTLANGEKVQVPFLNQSKAFAYLDIEDGQILELPYGYADFTFWALLPANQPGALVRLEKKLTPDNLDKWRAALKKSEVIVSLPKFKITWGSNSLIGPLEKLGLTAPFRPGADFSGITEKEPLVVSDVLQKAYVNVNEVGTEAAAATEVALLTSMRLIKPEVFTADRPFIFLIQEKNTGSVLFMGRLSDPRP